MKTMTCNQLGGACDMEFHAETFEEMAQLSQQHGSEMFQKGEPSHLQAMEQMQQMMKEPAAMQEWMDEKHSAFEAIPADN